VRDPKENHGKKWPREILSRALGSQVFARPFFSRGFLSRHARAHVRRTKRRGTTRSLIKTVLLLQCSHCVTHDLLDLMC